MGIINAEYFYDEIKKTKKMINFWQIDGVDYLKDGK
jgi:hypothetical protein